MSEGRSATSARGKIGSDKTYGEGQREHQTQSRKHETLASARNEIFHFRNEIFHFFSGARPENGIVSRALAQDTVSFLGTAPPRSEEFHF